LDGRCEEGLEDVSHRGLGEWGVAADLEAQLRAVVVAKQFAEKSRVSVSPRRKWELFHVLDSPEAAGMAVKLSTEQGRMTFAGQGRIPSAGQFVAECSPVVERLRSIVVALEGLVGVIAVGALVEPTNRFADGTASMGVAAALVAELVNGGGPTAVGMAAASAAVVEVVAIAKVDNCTGVDHTGVAAATTLAV